MPNPFDQFDEPSIAPQTRGAIGGGNPFDQFDEQPQHDLKAENPAEYDPQSPEYQAKYGAQSGLSNGEKQLALLGGRISQYGTGIKQLAGKATGSDAREESAVLDDLQSKTPYGGAISFAGRALPALPAAFIPGANAVAGAALIGGVTGLLSPTESDNILGGKALNAGLGAASAGILQKYLPGALSYAGKAISQVPEKLAEGGLLPESVGSKILEHKANDIFARQVGDPSKALSKLTGHRDVPGTQPTTAQILGDTESLMIERQLRESGGEAAVVLSDLRNASNKARYKYLTSELDKNPEKIWNAAREFAANAKGSMKVSAKGIDPNGLLIREVGRIRNSYGNERAKATFQELQDRIKEALVSKDPLDGLHQVRMYEIDDALSRLTQTDKKLASAMAKDFVGIKKFMDQKIGDGLTRTGAWQKFLTGYSERARAATQAEAGQALLGKLDNLTPSSTGEPALTSGRTILRKAVGAEDNFGNPQYSPLAEDAISTVNKSIDMESRPLAPNIRPAGSATAANLNRPTQEALGALQPVIKGQGIGEGSAAPLAVAAQFLHPAAGAAVLATKKGGAILAGRSERAALNLARSLFERYRDPVTAVKVLSARAQAGQIPQQVANQTVALLRQLAQSGGAAGTAGASTQPANSLLQPDYQR